MNDMNANEDWNFFRDKWLKNILLTVNIEKKRKLYINNEVEKLRTENLASTVSKYKGSSRCPQDSY